MKPLVFIVAVVITSCNASKAVQGDPDIPTYPRAAIIDSIPVCLKKLIIQYKSEEKQNPPRSIYSYTFKGQTVYYVSAPCCDFFSDLYDSSCNLIAHPDGGITGRGDGKLPDFAETRSNEKLVWKDERK